MSLYFWSRLHAFSTWAMRVSTTLMEISWAKATKANIDEINRRRRDF
jgi:hypothetical protein